MWPAPDFNKLRDCGTIIQKEIKMYNSFILKLANRPGRHALKLNRPRRSGLLICGSGTRYQQKAIKTLRRF